MNQQELGLLQDEVEALKYRQDTIQSLRNTEPVGIALALESELLGMQMTEHPLRQIMPKLRRMGCLLNSELKSTMPDVDKKNYQRIKIGGIVKDIRDKRDKNGNLMAWVSIEDTSGVTQVTVFANQLAKTASHFVKGNLVIVTGKAQHRPMRGKQSDEEIESEIIEDKDLVSAITYEVLLESVESVGMVYA